MDFFNHPIYADYSFFSFFSSQFLLISPPPVQIHSLYIYTEIDGVYQEINENTVESH